MDLDRRSLAVTQARVAAGYAVHVGDPKTDRSRRTVRLSDEAIARLREWRQAQREAHLALGLPRAEYVVTSPDGTLPHPQSVTYRFERAVRVVGVSAIRYHDLRHTFATTCLEAGVNVKVVQEALGHSSSTITLDVYSHVTDGMQETAAAAIDAAFGRRTP